MNKVRLPADNRNTRTRVRDRVRVFLRDQTASVTVEFVLWIPVFFFILFLTVEVSNLFLAQSAMWNAARDTARQFSNGTLTASAATSYAKNKLAGAGYTVTVVSKTTGADVSVAISASMRDVLTFSYSPMAAFAASSLTAKVTLRKEPV